MFGVCVYIRINYFVEDFGTFMRSCELQTGATKTNWFLQLILILS